MNVDYTEDQALTSLWAFLTYLMPDVVVVRGQTNMVPLPQGKCIVMTPLTLAALHVPVREYDRAQGQSLHQQGKEWRVQLDCYGENAADMASGLQTIFRSSAATEYFEQYAVDNSLPMSLQALYAGEPRNMAFINEAANYEGRWMVEVHLQINQTVSLPQQFAEQLSVGLVEVDTTLSRLN